MVAVLPRHKPNWPAPGAYEEESPKRFKGMGAPSNPLPTLLPGGKAISAATIRLGLGWMEVPFVATQVHCNGQQAKISNPSHGGCYNISTDSGEARGVCVC